VAGTETTAKAKRAQVAARRARVVQLRQMGWPFAAIAAEVDLPNARAASKDFARALAENIELEREAVETYLQEAIDRNAMALREAWAMYHRPHLLIQAGRVVHVEAADGRQVPVRDEGPKATALNLIGRLEVERNKLLGLYAAMQVEHHGTVDYRFNGVDIAKAFPPANAKKETA
jgi:hypothetical protein